MINDNTQLCLHSLYNKCIEIANTLIRSDDGLIKLKPKRFL